MDCVPCELLFTLAGELVGNRLTALLFLTSHSPWAWREGAFFVSSTKIPCRTRFSPEWLLTVGGWLQLLGCSGLSRAWPPSPGGQPQSSLGPQRSISLLEVLGTPSPVGEDTQFQTSPGAEQLLALLFRKIICVSVNHDKNVVFGALGASSHRVLWQEQASQSPGAVLGGQF